MATERLEDKTFTAKAREFFKFLKEIRKTVVVFLICVTFLTAGFFDIELFGWLEWLITGNSKYFVIGFLISAVLLYIPTKKLISVFYSPRTSVLVELNSNSEPRISIYELGDQLIDDLTFEGDKWKADRGKNGIQIYFCRDYDVEENHAVVSAMDELTEVELMEYREKIEEYRFRKNKWVKVGRKLYSKFPTIVENIEARFWKNQTDDVMDVLDFDRKEIMEAVEQEIQEKQEDDDTTEKERAEDVIDSISIETSQGGQKNE